MASRAGCNRALWGRAEKGMMGQGKAELGTMGRAEQGMMGQGRTGYDEAERNRVQRSRAEQGTMEQGTTGYDRAG